MIQSLFLSQYGNVIATYYDTDSKKNFVFNKTESKVFANVKALGNTWLTAFVKGERTIDFPQSAIIDNSRVISSSKEMQSFGVKDVKLDPRINLESPEFIDKESV